MSATDLLYYDMTPSPHGRSGRRRTKVVTVAARPHAQQQAEMKELGIGTRSCFSFRVPRTITTSDMSEGDVSQSQLHQPDYERLEKRGLLQSMKNSPSSQTTASMTATPVSSPESDGNFSSSTRGSLLAMPTPIDRSHKRRLQMERGLGNTYDGEQEPAGYRGQEASSERKPNRVEVSMTATTDRSRHTRAVDRRMRVANDGEMEAVQHNSSNRSDTAKSAPTTPVHLLAMPTPQDRSHRRRLEMERQGTGYTYDGEQEPAGYRGQHSNVPMAVSTELSATIPSAHRQSSRSQHLRRRVEPDRPTDDDGDDVVAHLFSETDMILDNVIRNSRSRRQTDIHEGHETPAGSPYLQFSPEGPAIRGFEPSRQRNKLASSNSSLAISENASITSDEHIRLMVSDLVPLSPSSEEEAMSRVSTTAKLSIHKNEQLSMKATLRTPTRSRDYGTETTDASSTSATSDAPKRFRKMQGDAQQVTPERRALAILRSGSQDSSLYSSSTHSSENLRSMMGDLLLDAGDNPSLPSQIGKHSKLPDANQMAVAAQNHVEQGEYDIALVLLGRVLDIYQKQHGARHPLVASAYHNLGMVHAQRADILLEGTLQQTHVRQQSLECFQRAARTARDSLGKNHPNVAVSLVKIGFLLLQARQFNPALITFEEALRIRTVHYASNPHHPLIANLHNNIGTWNDTKYLVPPANAHIFILGVAHLHLQNFSESKDSLTRALNIQRHNLRVKRMKCTREDLRARLLEVADTLANLGGLGLEWLRQDGTNEKVMWEAESHLAESLEIRSTVLGHQHPLSLQVKSLHDMVRTNSSLMPQEIGPTFRCNQTPNKSRKVAIHTDLSTREPDSFGISRNLPASPSTATPGSPGRSIKVAQDAPAPKADSSSPLLELIAQSIAARKLRSKHVLSQPVKPLSRGARVGTRAVAPPRPLDAASTVSDVAPTDEDDSLLNDPPKRRRSRTLEKTKIYIEPHYIPRQSPTRKSSSPDGSFVSDTRTPVAPSSSESDSSLGRQSSSHAYDAEESCLINGSGDRVDLLSSFLVRGGDDDDDGVNLSSHEIMVVRPSASVPSRDTLGQLVQPLAQTMRGRWTGDTRRKPLSPPRGGVDKEFEENDEGIAPLSRHHFAIIDQKVRLSKGMLENPERHLSDIHVVASRYLKVSPQRMF